MTKARSNATANAAKGDLRAGTGTNISGILSVGSDGYTLVADSSTSTGLNYAPRGWTLISTTSLSGASVSLSSIPQTYNSLKLIIQGVTNSTANGNLTIKPNNSSSIAYVSYIEGTTTYTSAGGDLKTQTVMDRTSPDNNFDFDFDRYFDTTAGSSRNIKGSYYYYQASAKPSTVFGVFYLPSTAITSLVLSNSGGNFSAGTAYLYGVN